MADRLTIRKPDDWHLHVRDQEMLKAVLPFTAKHFGRAILMPNLVPPVRTTADAVAYRGRVMAALPPGSTFKPLMTCYLTDETDPDDVDIFDREAVFVEKRLEPWTREYPELKFILEHLSSKIGVDFVRAHAPQVGGTITPYHLELNRTDWLGWGLKPYMYAMPVIKTEKEDRKSTRLNS